MITVDVPMNQLDVVYHGEVGVLHGHVAYEYTPEEPSLGWDDPGCSAEVTYQECSGAWFEGDASVAMDITDDEFNDMVDSFDRLRLEDIAHEIGQDTCSGDN